MQEQSTLTCRDEVDLGRDRRSLRQPLEPVGQCSRTTPGRRRACHGRERSRGVPGVGEPELTPRQIWLLLEHRVQSRERCTEAVRGAVLAAPQRVVRARQLVEAEHEQPPERALARIRRPQRRLRVTLLQVLVDHGRLGEHEGVLLEDGHLAQRVLLVDPRGAVVEVDLHGLVLDPLLCEHDADARAVWAAVGVVERDHRSILVSSPNTLAICSISSRAGGSSDGDAAVRTTARTCAGSAPVRRDIIVAFADSESSSALFSSP